MRRLPMFPLEAVLLPHTLLPLHVFEPRYQALVTDCLAADREFGVVLIERGSEVGGGDVRLGAGTVATIVDARPIPEGRWFLLAEGRVRFRVVEWLPDDPYPVAEIEELADPDWYDTEGFRDRAIRQLQRLAALRTELGEETRSISVHVDEDPVRASYEAVALARLSPLDTQHLLVAPTPAARYDHLFRLLAEEATALEQQIASG